MLYKSKSLFYSLVLLVVSTFPVLAADTSNPLGLRMYSQDIVVTYRTKDDAQKAMLGIMPVFEGKKWAFSARWDDNSGYDFPVHDLMVKYGLKGSFYLNRSYPTFGLDAVQKLIAGGCSIAGHTQTHADLPTLLANEMFYEVLANRIQREAEADQTINSFAFPCGVFSSKSDPQAIQAVTEVLVRSGFHNSTYIDFARKNSHLLPYEMSTGHQVYPGDHKVNAKWFDGQIQIIEKDRENRIKDTYLIHMGVHARQTGKELEVLESVFAKYAHRSDWWYCNMTEYAAYDRQYHNTTIELLQDKGEVRQYRITRPIPSELGNDVPLTLEISQADVKSVDSVGFQNERIENSERFLLNLHHSPKQASPTRIDVINNDNNAVEASSDARLAKFPGLHIWLYCDQASNELRVTVRNDGKLPLVNLRPTLRLPSRFIDGLRRLPALDIAAGQEQVIISPLGKQRTENVFREGRGYLVAELDFHLADEVGRIFATTRLPAQPSTEPALRDAVSMLGPLVEGDMKFESMSKVSIYGSNLEDMIHPDRKWFTSSESDRDKYHPECATCFTKDKSWVSLAQGLSGKPQSFLIAVDFTLEQSTNLNLIIDPVAQVTGILLNGQQMDSGEVVHGAVSGTNRLILQLFFKNGRVTWGKFPVFIRIRPEAGELQYKVSPPQ